MADQCCDSGQIIGNRCCHAYVTNYSGSSSQVSSLALFPSSTNITCYPWVIESHTRYDIELLLDTYHLLFLQANNLITTDDMIVGVFREEGGHCRQNHSSPSRCAYMPAVSIFHSPAGWNGKLVCWYTKCHFTRVRSCRSSQPGALLPANRYVGTSVYQQ